MNTTIIPALAALKAGQLCPKEIMAEEEKIIKFMENFWEYFKVATKLNELALGLQTGMA